MSQLPIEKDPIKIEKGRECLLNFIGRHYKSNILEVGKDSLRVSFPVRDYPIPGLKIVLEFHDDYGFYYMPTIVLQGPQDGSGSLMLQKADDLKRSTHRDSFRIPTDLTVRVRDDIHIRRYDAALVNISAGGALIRTDAAFDFHSTVEMTLSLPGEPLHMLLCQVVHVATSEAINGSSVRIYGLRFIGLDPEIERAITRYIFRMLPQLDT